MTYSQTIFVVKILLPLVAILLIVGVFALSRGKNDQSKLPFSISEISNRLKEQVVSNPQYIGSTQNGTEVRVTAEKLVPEQDGRKYTTFHSVRAQFLRDQSTIGEITADLATLQSATDEVEFNGNVIMTDNKKRQVRAASLQANTDMTHAIFEGQVTLSQGKNRISSTRLEISRQSSSAPSRFVFTDQVKLLYIPE